MTRKSPVDDLETPPRIDDTLRRAVEAWPGKPAVVERSESWTYAELGDAARRFATVLRMRGASPGDRVSIFLDKSYPSVVALFGTWLAGAVAVPVADVLRGRQVEHIVRHSGTKILVSSSRKLRRIGWTPSDDLALVDASAPSWLDAEPDAPASDAAGGDEPAAILYTSGSTGLPKGILISHDNLVAGARIVATYLEIRHDERILSVLPFSFDYGLNQVLTSVLRGATLVLQRSHLPADICRSLSEHEITAMAAVPPLFLQLVGPHSPLPEMELPSLRYVTNSGGAFPVETIRRYRELLPHVRIYLMYGLSEAFRSTYLPPHLIDEHPTSMGRAIPETEILAVRDDGREADVGEVGELVHRGPTVALGYWRDPEATARVFRPDPFDEAASRPVVFSGDLVRRDPDGLFTFMGRKDAMIKSHGYRISPEEVEEIVYGTGLVREVAARGVPDEIAGATVVVYCVPHDADRFQPDELLERCRTEMPRYMLPTRVFVREALPRTSSGKLDRKSIS